MDCIFCKIISGELPSEKFYEDEKILAFYDLNPIAPVHLLVVPKLHLDSLNEVDCGNIEYITHILSKIPQLAKECENGYRVVVNTGEDGGQTVNHLHFHIIGGRKLAYMG